MQTLIPAEEVLLKLHKKQHPAWSRQLWDRKGRTGLSIPSAIVEADHVKTGDHVALVITSQGKLYLTTMNPTPENRDGLTELLGPCFLVDTQTRSLGKTLFITFPTNVVALDHMAPGDAVIIALSQQNLYRIVTLDEIGGHNG